MLQNKTVDKQHEPVDMYETRSFADRIHKTIPYSGLEKYILLSPVMTRLHRVLQNSLVYLTYPSNKTRRFEHCVGTMHLAGSMLASALANTSTDNLSEIFSSASQDLESKCKNKNRHETWNNNYSASILAHNDPSDLFTFKKELKHYGTFFAQNIPANVPSEWHYLCAVLLQGVRIAGLLHDIGHLPHSHTIEAALSDVNNIIKEKNNNGQASKGNKAKFFELSQRLKLFESEGVKKKLHEQIGKKLLPVVERDVCLLEINARYKRHNKIEPSENMIFRLHSFEVARLILGADTSDKDDSSGFIQKTFKPLISGMLDADRLDYVSRDLIASGVSIDVLAYNRILLSLSFEKYNDAADSDFILAIAPKTIADVEEVLRRRWKIYRDINYHHSSNKSNLLLQRKLVELATTSPDSTRYADFLSELTKILNSSDYDSQKAENIKELYNFWCNADFLSELTKILNSSDNTSQKIEKIQLMYSFWCDADFLSELTKALEILDYSGYNQQIVDTITKLDDSWLETLPGLRDFITKERDTFITVIKRYDEFLELDEHLFGHFYSCIRDNFSDRVKKLFDDYHEHKQTKKPQSSGDVPTQEDSRYKWLRKLKGFFEEINEAVNHKSNECIDLKKAYDTWRLNARSLFYYIITEEVSRIGEDTIFDKDTMFKEMKRFLLNNIIVNPVCDEDIIIEKCEWSDGIEADSIEDEPNLEALFIKGHFTTTKSGKRVLADFNHLSALRSYLKAERWLLTPFHMYQKNTGKIGPNELRDLRLETAEAISTMIFNSINETVTTIESSINKEC